MTRLEEIIARLEQLADRSLPHDDEEEHCEGDDLLLEALAIVSAETNLAETAARIEALYRIAQQSWWYA